MSSFPQEHKQRPPVKPSSTSTCVSVGKISMGMVVPPPQKKPRPSASSDGANVDTAAAVSVSDINDEFTCHRERHGRSPSLHCHMAMQ